MHMIEKCGIALTQYRIILAEVILFYKIIDYPLVAFVVGVNPIGK